MKIFGFSGLVKTKPIKPNFEANLVKMGNHERTRAVSYDFLQKRNSSQDLQVLRNLPVQFSMMPMRDKAKSYLTGSAGSIFLKLSVISIAAFIDNVFLLYRPNILHSLAICVSTGTTSFDLSIDFQRPKSTSSLRTIQRKNIFNLLQTLPLEGLDKRNWKPLLIGRRELFSYRR